MATPLKIAVCGASGRTGSRVAALAAGDPRFHLLARVDRGRTEQFEDEVGACGAVIDFSVPEATVRYAAVCSRAGVPFVSGTTGLNDIQRAQIAAGSKRAPVFLAPNFSKGVTLMMHLASVAARRLEGYDAALVENHHKEKKDTPSGTALRLSQAVMEGRGSKEPVPTTSLRMGDVVGDHDLIFVGPFERLTIAHQAQSRDVFARGALDAAVWVSKKKTGFYDMLDLLALR